MFYISCICAQITALVKFQKRPRDLVGGQYCVKFTMTCTGRGRCFGSAEIIGIIFGKCIGRWGFVIDAP